MSTMGNEQSSYAPVASNHISPSNPTTGNGHSPVDSNQPPPSPPPSPPPHQEVFGRLKVRERDYKHVPSDEDWIMAAEFCDKLEVFYSVTELFSGTSYPTSNSYCPKICEIRLSLSEWLESENLVIKDLAANMIIKFDKYWGMINGVMAIGAVLDPIYKMKLLNLFFPLMYGNESDKEMRKVRKLLEDLISEYQARDGNRRNVVAPSDSTSSSTITTSSLTKKEKWKNNYFQFVQDTSGDDIIKSELDSYFEEPVMLNKSNEEFFDILGYWKNIGAKYPTLQKIARDFLAIPVSTVASESAFSNGGRLLSPHRSRLHPHTVEAMMCTQDWLRAPIIVTLKGKMPSSCQTVLEDNDTNDRASCT